LPPEAFQWCYEHVKEDLWIASSSGGTDVCTAFILGSPILPVYAGELQCRGLGADIKSFNMAGESVIEDIGELVLTKPFPSMPIYFWNDEDGSRLQESYFDMFPGIWRHGDYLKITDRGTCVIYGRSYATINRGGITSVTLEFYRVLAQVSSVINSLILALPLYVSLSFLYLSLVINLVYLLPNEIKKTIKKQILTLCLPCDVTTYMYDFF